jgi:hypothetical protein
MSSKNILLKKNMGFLFVAILSIGIVTEISLITYASALNYYFNCVTKNVNKDGSFEMQEAFVCYDNVFKGAQKYSNEPYQNPDLTNLDNIKPVADYTSDASTNDDEKTNDIITPSKVEEEVEKSNGNPAAEDATETSNGNPAAEEEKDLESGGTEIGAKPLTSEESPNVGIADKPSSGPQSQSPANENSNTNGSPNLGTNAGVYDISPFYNSFDLPFTAVIPQ